MLRVNQLVGFNNKRPGLRDPIAIATTCHAWWDGSDASTITEATGVSNWVAKGDNAWDLSQATGANQPPYVAADGYVDVQAGDSLAETTVTGLSSESAGVVWVLARIDSTGGQGVMFGEPGFGDYFGHVQSGSPLAPYSGSGTPSAYVDDVLVSPETAGQNWTDMATDTDIVIEFRDVDFTNWTAFSLSGWDGSWITEGRYYQIAITDSMNATQRAQMHEFLNSKKP